MSNIPNIVKQIRTATDYQVSKRILREKIQTELHLAHNGGMFKLTTDLLSFLKGWPTDVLYLEDIYQNPIEVDRQVFLDQAQQHYHRVMNEWHQQHEDLKKIRKV